jgi:hypothetical protein
MKVARRMIKNERRETKSEDEQARRRKISVKGEKKQTQCGENKCYALDVSINSSVVDR